MTGSSSDRWQKLNWTKYVYDRQILGSMNPRIGIRRTLFESQLTRKRLGALRIYKLSSIVASEADLEHVFLGFSLCGSYLYSYLEAPGTEVTIWSGSSVYPPITEAGRSYEFYVWRFVPGRKLQQVFRTKLFNGESFLDSISVRVEQRADMPNVCVVIGSVTGRESSTMTKAVWHSILFTPPNHPSCIYQFNFHALYVLFSGHRLHDRYLAVATCDELILLDLKETFSRLQRMSESVCEIAADETSDSVISPVIMENAGDISRAKLDFAHYFSYSSQTLQWCTKNCEANLNSTCVGLSDYHLSVDSLTDDTCTGCVFALFDVDTTERHYFEAMFTFHWDLPHNNVELLTATSLDVTDRSKEPGKQLKLFHELRKDLFAKPVLPMKELYQLSNYPVLQGYSLQWIVDATGCIVLTL